MNDVDWETEQTMANRCAWVFGAALAAAVTAAGCGGGGTLAIVADRSDGLAADGAARDWDALSARYIEADRVVVGAATDGERLFVLLWFRDPQYAAQIRSEGLTLALDPTGGFGERFVLHYRGMPAGTDGVPAALQAELRRLRSAAPGDTLRAEELRIAIRDEIETKPIPATGEEGPSAAAGFDQGFFVYEFQVPLGKSAVRQYRVPAAPDAEVGVVLEWGGRAEADLLNEIAGGGLMVDGPLFPTADEPPRRDGAEDPGKSRLGRHEIRLRVSLGGR